MTRKKKWLLALLCPLLLSPGWLGVTGLTAMAGLVPLMMISAAAGTSRRQAWGVFGFTALALGLWAAATTWWIWIAAPIGAILSVVITSVLMGGAFMLFHYVSKRAPKPLAYTLLITAWIAAEYLYTVGEFSFPWLTLGNAFGNDIRAVQWYTATGVFGGSLWVLLGNILLFEAVASRRKSFRAALAAVFAVPLTVSLVQYYTFEESAEKVKITVVQPNIDPYEEKYALSPTQQVGILTSLMGQAPREVDYIITPETSAGRTLEEDMLDIAPILEPFRAAIREHAPGATLILGASTSRYYAESERSSTARQIDPGVWYDNFNSVLGVDTTTRVQLRHKSLLVIGAEKTPYYKYLRGETVLAIDLGGFMGQCGFDPDPHVFRDARGVLSGPAVCYEGVYGGYMNGFAKLGAQILFIISNDGWWGDTSGYRELFALSRLRAVELRRAVARSANTGISGFITPRGEVLQKMGWDVRGTLTDELPLENRMTFYARYGDYIARIAAYVLALCVLYFIAYRIRRKDHLVR